MPCLAPNWAEDKASNVNSSSTQTPIAKAIHSDSIVGSLYKATFCFLAHPTIGTTNTQGIPKHQKATDTTVKHISCTTEQVITGHVTGDLTAVLSNQIKFIIFSMSSMFGPWTPILQGV